MKTIASIIACLLLVTSGRADDNGRQPYAARYEKWLPHVSNTLVVTISVGDAAHGLRSGLFSAHLLRLEPGAMRPDGTRLSGHAVVTVEEMKTMLTLIDGIGAFAEFSTCKDDNWREPDGEPTRVKVVWRSKEEGRTYDWYVLSQVRMREVLRKLRGSLRSQEAVEVIEGLIEGYNTRQESEKKEANKPSEATR